MTLSGPTGHLGEEFDMCMLPKGKGSGWLSDSVNSYVGKNDIYSPMLSFICDEGGKLPPTYISTGTADRLYGEDLVLALTRSAKGENIVFDLYEEMFRGLSLNAELHAITLILILILLLTDDFQLIVTAPIAQVFYKRYSDFARAVTSGQTPATKMSFVKADGSSSEISVADAKNRLKELLARGEKAGIMADADAKVLAVYNKAAN